MAGKPERVPPGHPSPAPPCSQQQQTQAPLQNVIVYVSENFPQTYMTQQNVECSEAYSNNINGSGYINSAPSSASMNTNNLVLKHGKNQEFLSNGFLPVQNNGSYFASNNNGERIVAQNNTFSSCQMAPNMMNNFAYTSNGNAIINHGFNSMKCASDGSEHQISLQQSNGICSSNGTAQHLMMSNGDSMGVYAVAQHQQNLPVSGMQQFNTSNQFESKQGHDDGNIDNYMTVMGDSNVNGVPDPRCDSVRSDAAESSCSSLSSDCPQEGSNNSVTLLVQPNQVQSQVDVNQHSFEAGQDVSGFLNQSAASPSQVFTSNGQQVLVNSNMGQHVVQPGMSQQYIPPGEHQIQIVQGNIPTSGNTTQFLQSGANRIVVTSNPSVNCSTPQMASSIQSQPQLVATSSSNQLQLFPQNMNPVHVVTSQVSGPQAGIVCGGKPALQQHLPTSISGTERQLVELQNQPQLVTTMANSGVPPVTTNVHQSVQFVKTVAGNQKTMSLGSNQCTVPTQGSSEAVIGSGDVSAVKMQSNCSNPQVNQISGPQVETVVVPNSLPPHSVLVPFGWKRLHNNGSVFYIR